MQICMCETRNIPHQHNGAVVPEPGSQRKIMKMFIYFQPGFLSGDSFVQSKWKFLFKQCSKLTGN